MRGPPGGASIVAENVAQRDAPGRAAGTGKTHVAAAVALAASKNLPEKDRLPGAVFIPRGLKAGPVLEN